MLICRKENNYAYFFVCQGTVFMNNGFPVREPSRTSFLLDTWLCLDVIFWKLSGCTLYCEKVWPLDNDPSKMWWLFLFIFFSFCLPVFFLWNPLPLPSYKMLDPPLWLWKGYNRRFGMSVARGALEGEEGEISFTGWAIQKRKLGAWSGPRKRATLCLSKPLKWFLRDKFRSYYYRLGAVKGRGTSVVLRILTMKPPGK